MPRGREQEGLPPPGAGARPGRSPRNAGGGGPRLRGIRRTRPGGQTLGVRGGRGRGRGRGGRGRAQARGRQRASSWAGGGGSRPRGA